MPKNKMTRFVSLFTLLLMPSFLLARSGGPDDGLTNSPPNQQNCTECHSSFAFNSGQGTLNLQGLPESYQPGETYRLTLALADPNARRWGFELTALTSNNSRGGNLAVVNQQATQLSNNNNQPQYLKHRSAGTFPRQANSASWIFDWTAPREGTGEITFYFCGNAANNNDNSSGDRIYGSERTLVEAEPPPPPPPPDSIIVTVASGWNLISAPVAPDSIMVANLFAPLIDAGSLIVLRDAAGRIFNPAERVNEIGNWMVFSSYQIKVTEDAEIKFSGEFVDPSHSYPVESGWNWISYPRLDTIHPSQVMDLIGDRASIVRDGRGNFAIPGLALSDLPMILPGNGLQILSVTNEPFEFIWPEPDRNLEPPTAPSLPTQFSNGTNTGSSMSIAVSSWSLLGEISNGDELGVSSVEGLPLGAGVISGDTLLLTVWGDDDMTEAVDGARDSDTLIFTYWYAVGDSEEITEAMTIQNEQVVYMTNSFMEISLTTTPPDAVKPDNLTKPSEFQLLGLYPNPFNPVAEVSFSLSEAGLVKVGLFDVSGKLLRDLGVSSLGKGENRLSINGDGLPVGLYLVGVESGGVRKMIRAVLLK